MPLSSPLESPSEKAKTVERSIPIARGLRSSMTVVERLPLLVAPELGLLAAPRRSTAAAFVERTRLEDAALRGAAERDPLDARRRGRRRAAAHVSKNT